MAKKTQKSLTTAEFSKLAGIPAATVSKLLREGKLKGTKTSGRWMIAAEQLKSEAVLALSQKKRPVKAAAKKTAPEAPQSAPAKAGEKETQDSARAGIADRQPKTASKTFSISEFSRLTFLTESGVETFLKMGRLKGSKDDQGQWRVDAANLDHPNIRHLVR